MSLIQLKTTKKAKYYSRDTLRTQKKKIARHEKNAIEQSRLVMESFLLQHDSADLGGLGFKRERGVSLALEGTLDLFPGMDEPTTMSGMSTHSEDEGDSHHQGSFGLKRKFSCIDGEAHESDIKMRRIERQGPDVYAVDGQQVPRLQLGESGRAQLKAAISSVLKRRPDLRKQCNAIQKVKNASIVQLLAMARICGIWDQAVRISESFLRRYPCKKTAGGCGSVAEAAGRLNVPLCSLLMGESEGATPSLSIL